MHAGPNRHQTGKGRERAASPGPCCGHACSPGRDHVHRVLDGDEVARDVDDAGGLVEAGVGVHEVKVVGLFDVPHQLALQVAVPAHPCQAPAACASTRVQRVVRSTDGAPWPRRRSKANSNVAHLSHHDQGSHASPGIEVSAVASQTHARVTRVRRAGEAKYSSAWCTYL